MKGAFISAHKCTKRVFFSVEAEKKCPPFPPDAFWFLQNTEISGKIGKNIIRKVFDIHDTCTFYLPRHSSFMIMHTFADWGNTGQNMAESIGNTTVSTTKAYAKK